MNFCDDRTNIERYSSRCGRAGFRAGQTGHMPKGPHQKWPPPKRAPTNWSFDTRPPPPAPPLIPPRPPPPPPPHTPLNVIAYGQSTLSAAYANSGPDLGRGRLAPGKMRLAAHITLKYILPRGSHSLKSGPALRNCL